MKKNLLCKNTKLFASRMKILISIFFELRIQKKRSAVFTQKKLFYKKKDSASFFILNFRLRTSDFRLRTFPRLRLFSETLFINRCYLCAKNSPITNSCQAERNVSAIKWQPTSGRNSFGRIVIRRKSVKYYILFSNQKGLAGSPASPLFVDVLYNRRAAQS